MDSSNHVGLPCLLSSEVVFPSDETSENLHCVLKINVENKSEDEESFKEYNINLPPKTLRTLLDSFGKIKTQLHLLSEKQNS